MPCPWSNGVRGRNGPAPPRCEREWRHNGPNGPNNTLGADHDHRGGTYNNDLNHCYHRAASNYGNHGSAPGAGHNSQYGAAGSSDDERAARASGADAGPTDDEHAGDDRPADNEHDAVHDDNDRHHPYNNDERANRRPAWCSRSPWGSGLNEKRRNVSPAVLERWAGCGPLSHSSRLDSVTNADRRRRLVS